MVNYIQRMQHMAREGASRDEIAEEMMVSRKWVDMVMDTDAFRIEQKGEGHVKGEDAGDQAAAC